MTLITLSGTVKWFDASKGYGFVSSPEIAEGIFLHARTFRGSIYNTVLPDASIRFEAVQHVEGRWRVSKILALQGGEARPPKLKCLPVAAEGEWERAIVKWFNRARGFGFLALMSGGPDILVPMAVLRQSGRVDLAPGSMIFVRYGKGPKGAVASDLSAVSATCTGSALFPGHNC